MLNTPSMLCIEDAIDALTWVEKTGGFEVLLNRVSANFAVVESWVQQHEHMSFLACDPATISPVSMTLKITAPWFTEMKLAARNGFIDRVTGMLAEEGIAYDIASYRAAPPGFRLWGGPMVEADDLAALLPWLDWAMEEVAEA
jgi:phosphoserine aminotransferase